jgi:hypothetical protein
VLFVLLVVSYVNIVKNLEAVWFPNHTVAQQLADYSTYTWFHLAYLALALAISVPVLAYWRGRELPVMPSSRLGKAQLLYVVFLWWIVLGNLSRTVPFAEQRLITEGVIHLGACASTLLALLLPSRERMAEEPIAADFLTMIKRFGASLALVVIIVVVAEFGVVRALWGDTFAGHGGLHIRFGPDATVSDE